MAIGHNALLNIEGVIAVTFLLLIVWRSRTDGPAMADNQPGSSPRTTWLEFSLIILVIVLLFARSLTMPLLHDSFAHVTNAANESFDEVLGTFYTHPRGGDFFFRPLGNLTYWFDSKWAGFDAMRWHAWNLSVHLINSGLVYALGRKLALSVRAAQISALLFALHGSRPEAVCWVAARFDLLAALFVMASLLALILRLETRRRSWFAVTMICAVCALLSKESAFCLPLLAAALMPFLDQPKRKEMLRGTLILVALCFAVFLYRRWVIGGIGGYQTPAGEAAILRFSIVRTLKALLFRQWAVLFFPVNWSMGADVWLKFGLALGLMGIGGLLFLSRPDRRRLLACLALVIAAALPVQHLLLIGWDLNGARVMYLPVLGMALLLGVIFEGCKGNVGTALMGGILALQIAALNQNMRIWGSVAERARQSCQMIGEQLSRDSRPIAVYGLPATLDGVFFLRNAFPQCVKVISGQRADRVYVDPSTSAPEAREFVWDSTRQKFVERMAGQR